MRLRFDEMPKPIRERIVELSRAPKDPRVLAAQTEMAGGWFKYVTLVGGVGVCFATLQFLFERAGSHIAPYHDREIFAAFAGGVFLVCVSVASIVFMKLFPPPPYQTGTWATTSYLMRLSRGWVELLPISELGKPTIVTVMRNGSYSGSRLQLGGGWTFYFSSRQAVEEACNKILAAREVFAKALAAKDARALMQLDAFSECTLSNIWSSPGAVDAAEGPKSSLVPGAFRAAQWFGSLAAGGGLSALAFAMFQSRFAGS